VSRHIISLIGYGGSGKSSVANHLHEKYGSAVFTFSKVIREYIEANGLALKKRADFAQAHAAIIEKFGPSYMTAAILALPGELVCVDDLRSQLYSDVLRKAGGKTMAFECPPAIRFAHVRNHADKVKYPPTKEAFIRNEQEDETITLGAGLDLDTASLMQQADYHIDASKSLESTFRQTDAIIDSLLQ
jgi:cytidylate kinase